MAYFSKLTFIAITFTSLALTSAAAHAALGENESSVEKDHTKFAGIKKSAVTKTTETGYTVHEMTIDATQIREYVSSSGTVFAVAWNGFSHPDLSKLLGSYNADYEHQKKNHQRIPGRRHVSLKSDRLVVEKWGHMRDLHGRAYSPSLMPTGVSLDDIK